MSEAFRILTVCTGNVCRSPLAAQLLEVRLAALPGVRVESAGVRALEGEPLPVETQEVARALGAIAPQVHRARQVTEQLLDGSDLILAMAREHRRAIVELSPRAARRTFTLRELARYAPVVTDEDIHAELTAGASGGLAHLTAAVRALAIGRALVPAKQAGVDDVIDPYGRPPEVHRRAGAEIAPAVDAAAAYLLRAWNLGQVA